MYGILRKLYHLHSTQEGLHNGIQIKITMADLDRKIGTAFAEGEVPPELYAAVGAAILKEEDLNAEQAGFLLKMCLALQGVWR